MRQWQLWSLLWELVLLFQVVLSTTFISTVNGDPENLIPNGDFEDSYISFYNYPQMDVIHDGRMDFMTSWQCVYGGVQILNAVEYLPDPIYGGKNIVHLNYRYGPGVIISSPLATPRKGATYNLSFDLADNPDGGPLFKILKITILVNNEIADPSIAPFNVSSPMSQRNTISWASVGATFVGSGESTTIQFESLTPGAFGALIDNVKVTLMTLVDNGSFEKTDSIMVQTNSSWYDMITGPSDIITSWTIVSGNIKRAGDERWQPSTDSSIYMLDLNAESEEGTIISDPFITLSGFNYVLLYDAAASPEEVTPVMGALFVCVKSSTSEDILAFSMTIVNADGFSQNSIGWETYTLPFKAVGSSAVVEFVSKIPGSDGPLLDNVQVYQVVPMGKFKHVPITWNTGTTPQSWPLLWIMIIIGIVLPLMKKIHKEILVILIFDLNTRLHLTY